MKFFAFLVLTVLIVSVITSPLPKKSGWKPEKGRETKKVDEQDVVKAETSSIIAETVTTEPSIDTTVADKIDIPKVPAVIENKDSDSVKAVDEHIVKELSTTIPQVLVEVATPKSELNQEVKDELVATIGESVETSTQVLIQEKTTIDNSIITNSKSKDLNQIDETSKNIEDEPTGFFDKIIHKEKKKLKEGLSEKILKTVASEKEPTLIVIMDKTKTKMGGVTETKPLENVKKDDIKQVSESTEIKELKGDDEQTVVINSALSKNEEISVVKTEEIKIEVPKKEISQPSKESSVDVTITEAVTPSVEVTTQQLIETRSIKPTLEPENSLNKLIPTNDGSKKDEAETTSMQTPTTVKIDVKNEEPKITENKSVDLFVTTAPVKLIVETSTMQTETTTSGTLNQTIPDKIVELLDGETKTDGPISTTTQAPTFVGTKKLNEKIEEPKTIEEKNDDLSVTKESAKPIIETSTVQTETTTSGILSQTIPDKIIEKFDGETKTNAATSTTMQAPTTVKIDIKPNEKIEEPKKSEAKSDDLSVGKEPIKPTVETSNVQTETTTSGILNQTSTATQAPTIAAEKTKVTEKVETKEAVVVSDNKKETELSSTESTPKEITATTIEKIEEKANDVINKLIPDKVMELTNADKDETSKMLDSTTTSSPITTIDTITTVQDELRTTVKVELKKPTLSEKKEDIQIVTEIPMQPVTETTTIKSETMASSILNKLVPDTISDLIGGEVKKAEVDMTLVTTTSQKTVIIEPVSSTETYTEKEESTTVLPATTLPTIAIADVQKPTKESEATKTTIAELDKKKSTSVPIPVEQKTEKPIKENVTIKVNEAKENTVPLKIETIGIDKDTTITTHRPILTSTETVLIIEAVKPSSEISILEEFTVSTSSPLTSKVNTHETVIKPIENKIIDTNAAKSTTEGLSMSKVTKNITATETGIKSMLPLVRTPKDLKFEEAIDELYKNLEGRSLTKELIEEIIKKAPSINAISTTTTPKPDTSVEETPTELHRHEVPILSGVPFGSPPISDEYSRTLSFLNLSS